MAFEIDAWVENGTPRLQILDADSRSVRLAWQATGAHDSNALQQLFRELMLLSLVQEFQTSACR